MRGPLAVVRDWWQRRAAKQHEHKEADVHGDVAEHVVEERERRLRFLQEQLDVVGRR